MNDDKRGNVERVSRLKAATATGEQLMKSNLNSPLLAPALDKLWAMRVDGELVCNFTHWHDQSERSDLWRAVCEADYVCERAMIMNVWQPNHHAA